jgi:hypothetical protein
VFLDIWREVGELFPKQLGGLGSLEAHSTVSACIEAYAATHDDFWLDEARRAFD